MKYKVDKKIKYFNGKELVVHEVGEVINYTQPTWEDFGMVKPIKEDKKEEKKPEVKKVVKKSVKK